MKLSEIKKARKSPTITVMIEPAEGQYGEFEVEVEYDYSPAETMRHGDDHTYDERVGATTDTGAALTTKAVEERDEDDKVVKTWPKGTDVTKLPGWSKADDKYLESKIDDALRDLHED